LDLVVAGTADAVLMVESEAKELIEDVMLGAVMFGHRGFQPVIDLIIRLAERAAKEPRNFATVDDAALRQRVAELVKPGLRQAYAISGKTERHDAIAEVKQKALMAIAEQSARDPASAPS